MSQSHSIAPSQSQPIKYGRAQLYIILLTPLIVMASSTWLYYSGILMPKGTTSEGLLLSPVVSVTEFGFPEPVIASGSERQWLMIQVSPECLSDCAEQAYIQRQIHVALGKYQSRMTRVLLTDNATQASALVEQYPGLVTQAVPVGGFSADLLERVPANVLNNNAVFISDPFGNVMLYFTPDHNYKQQIKDIKKLLKLSTIG